jgi:hypothetical protein
MALVRSDQKGLEEIQRIRTVMADGRPVLTEAQRDLIKKQTALLGEDGDAIIQDIQGEAETAGHLPADISRIIEKFCQELNRRVAGLERSNEVERARDPERLIQVEAMREQVTRFADAKAKGDNAGLMKVKQALHTLTEKFMKDVEADGKDGLSHDVAKMWKGEALAVVKDALEFLNHFGEDDPTSKPDDGLGPLRKAVGGVAALTEAVAKEVQEPDEERLRELARKLGAAKKEIMAMKRSLVVGQTANLATEANELASEAGEAIKASRKTIKGALRGMGAASDISEISGPTRAPHPPPTRPALGSLAAAWAPRNQSAGPTWPPQSTLTTITWPPPKLAPRPRIGGAGNELAALMQGLMGAQANDSGWPTFNGKYVEYPRFRKEWWAYRQTYHGHIRDKLVCRSLKEKSLASGVKMLVNDIDDLREAWNTLDTCFDRPKKYIAEALGPVVKFRSYKAFDNGAIREFYSLLQAAMMGARKAGLLYRLVNDQTLPSILAKMPPSDWRQWARERPTWMREAIEEAFWNFVDQKWRDALNVAAAEPPSWGSGSGKSAPQEGEKRGGMTEAKKLAKASVHLTGLDRKRPRQGDSGRKCIFADVMGCQGTHPLWHCKVFGKIQAKEREKIIEDNQLCPFCLLHDKARPCEAKQRTVNPACHVPNCKGKHIQKFA